MSVDPAINAALLNMCAQLQDTGNATASPSTTVAATGEQQPSSALALAPSAPAAAATSENSSSTRAPHLDSARSASDYEWLRSALASVESPEKRVKQLLFLLEDRTVDGAGGPVDAAERLEALEELSEMVEDVNWAAEFTLMQGPQRVLQVLRSERAKHSSTTTSKSDASAESEVALSSISLNTQLAMVIAHSAQLNEPVQAVYQTAHWEDVLLHLVWDTISTVKAVQGGVASDADAEKKTLSTATKLMQLLAALLHACSCLCRECPLNAIQFIQQGGLVALADVLKLTRAVAAGAQAAAAVQEAALSAAITTIHVEAVNATVAQDGAEEEKDEDDAVKYEPLIKAANKVTSRVFFFAAYLASTGVSSEDLIVLTCQHAEESDDEAVQKAAARELLELVSKSPKATKEAVHAHMPKRFYEWRRHLQHTAGDDPDECHDERQQFVEALDASN